MKIKNIMVAALAATVLWSCEKEDDDNNNPPAEQGKASVMLEYDHNFGSESFELNRYYDLPSGEKVLFTMASYYLSKPAFMDDAMEMTPLSPEYIIVRPDDAMTSLGEVAEGHLHTFNLSVGIDEATNTEDGVNGRQPSDFSDPNHPLAPQPEGMYWSWASGYIFVKMEGEIDYDADGVADTTFKYHLGTNEYRKDRSLMLHQDAEANDEVTIKVKVDFQKVFDGLDLQTDVLTMSMGAARPLGFTVMDNFDAGFSLESMSDHNHGKR